MKSEILEKKSKFINKINFDKTSIFEGNNLIVISTGIHDAECFSAVVIGKLFNDVKNEKPIGYSGNNFLKRDFVPITEPITITFFND